MLDADAAALLIVLTGNMLASCCTCFPSDRVKKGTSLPGDGLQQHTDGLPCGKTYMADAAAQ